MNRQQFETAMRAYWGLKAHESMPNWWNAQPAWEIYAENPAAFAHILPVQEAA